MSGKACGIKAFVEELCLFKIDSDGSSFALCVIALEVLVFLTCFRFLNTIVVKFLQPCVHSLNARLKLSPNLSQWFIAYLAACAPDLILSCVVTINDQESRAVSRLFGTSWVTLLLLPGLTIAFTSADQTPKALLPLTWVSMLSYAVTFLLLLWVLQDGEGTVSLQECLCMMSIYAVFSVIAIAVDSRFPDTEESAEIVLTELMPISREFEERLGDSIGNGSSALLLPRVSVAAQSSEVKKDWVHSLMGKVLIACPRGSPIERFALLGAVLAYFWLFIFTFLLDALTTRFDHLFGFSNQFVGSALLPVASKAPLLLSALEDGKLLEVTRETLDLTTFGVLVGLAFPWLLKCLAEGRPVQVLDRPLVVWVGTIFVLFALALSLVARRLPRREAVRLLLAGYLFILVTFALVDLNSE